MTAAAGLVYQLPHASIASGGFSQKLPLASQHTTSCQERPGRAKAMS